MYFIECSLLLIYTSLTTASFDSRRPGWLDRVVEYHRNKLFEDFSKEPHVEIKATIEPVPQGYVDSPAWDFDSVSRLMILIRESKAALPVRRALRRMLGGNNRRKMSFYESFKYFPSLSKKVPNDLYYDMYSGESPPDVVTDSGLFNNTDEGVVVVTNPVEARLPSAMISVSLLRNILEERAKAARYMPTTRRIIPWKPTTKTTSITTPGEPGTTQEGRVTTGSGATADHHTGTSANTAPPGTETVTENNVPTTSPAA